MVVATKLLEEVCAALQGMEEVECRRRAPGTGVHPLVDVVAKHYARLLGKIDNLTCNGANQAFIPALARQNHHTVMRHIRADRKHTRLCYDVLHLGFT